MAKYRALVVEDSLLLVGLLEQILERVDVEIVGPAGTVSEALQLAKSEHFHCAILDINLHGEMVFAVADVLTERAIPFIFSSGYVVKNVLPPRYADADVVSKPYDISRLLALLAAALTKADAGLPNPSAGH